MSEQTNVPNRSVEFVVEGVFHIKGRGWVVTRSMEASRVARDRGDVFRLGDTVRCGELVTTVKGVESDLLPRPYESQGGLLLDLAEDDLHIGQTWVLAGRAEQTAREVNDEHSR